MKHSTTMRTEAEREARYVAGYRAIPDTDEDFSGIARLASKLIDRQLR